jgi:hypothetical protein
MSQYGSDSLSLSRHTAQVALVNVRFSAWIWLSTKPNRESRTILTISGMARLIFRAANIAIGIDGIRDGFIPADCPPMHVADSR